jgi:hypothetical protein
MALLTALRRHRQCEPNKALSSLYHVMEQPALRAEGDPLPAGLHRVPKAIVWGYSPWGWLFGTLAVGMSANQFWGAGAGVEALLACLLCWMAHGGALHYFQRQTGWAWMTQENIASWENRCREWPFLQERVAQWLMTPRTLHEHILAGNCFYSWLVDEMPADYEPREVWLRVEKASMEAWLLMGRCSHVLTYKDGLLDSRSAMILADQEAFDAWKDSTFGERAAVKKVWETLRQSVTMDVQVEGRSRARI